MGFLAQEFKGVAFFLEGIGLGVGGAVHLEGVGLYLAGLSFAHRLDELSGYVNRGAGGDGLEVFVRELVHVEDNLQVLDRRAIVEGHELHVFVATAGAHPTLDIDVGADGFGRGEQLGYFGSFHIVM